MNRMKIAKVWSLEVETDSQNEWIEIGMIEDSNLHIEKRGNEIYELWFRINTEIQTKIENNRLKRRLKNIEIENGEPKRYVCIALNSYTVDKGKVIVLNPNKNVFVYRCTIGN